MDTPGRLKRYWQSYTGRMISGVLAIHIVLIPSLFYGMLFVVERNIQSQFVDQLRNNTFLYSSLMKQAVDNNNTIKQLELLDEVLFSGDVIFSQFINNDSTVLRPSASFDSTKVAFTEDYEFATNDDDIYFIALEISSDIDGRYLGTLKLGYDEQPIHDQIASAYRYGTFIAAGYLLISVFFVIFFGQRLVKPVSELRNLSRSIAAGDENISMDISTNIAEIKHLANDLDTMRQILLSRRRDVGNREKRLRAILDNAGEGIISINEHGIIQSFNRSAENMFGYTEEQVVGNNVSMLMPSPHKENHNAYIREFINTGTGKIIGTGRRLQAAHKDGSLIPVFLNVSQVKQDDEYIFIGILHDLSKEAALESRLSQFWNAMQQSPVSIMITDIYGNIEYVNPFFCKVTEYQEHEVIGKNSNILRSGETQTETYEELWRTISNGDVWRGTMQNRKKNGDLFWESATICPVLDNDNNITNYIALKEDITEHRIKELMLQQSMKLEVVGKMTNGIAHDFNNLLTIILGNLQFLQEDIHDDDIEEKLSLINDALSAAKDGSNVIKQILAFSRHQESEAELVEVNIFLKKLERLLIRTIPENVLMEILPPEGDEMIMIDAHLLESAILNLVINSRDAMPNGGKLVISCDNILIKNACEVEKGYINPGRYIIITVRDNGQGMSENIRRQVIEPFFSTKTSTTGTGLGLSMVYDFVTQTGGGLRISSQIDKGTTIELFLPIFEPVEDTPLIVNKEPTRAPGGKETVLIVEDREKLRHFARRALNRLGYQLLEAKSAAEALEYFDTDNKIDLLFTDIVMPGDMNGRQLANFVSAKNRSLKVLLTTGMETHEDSNKESGMNFPVLYKPYTVDELAKHVRSVLDMNLLIE